MVFQVSQEEEREVLCDGTESDAPAVVVEEFKQRNVAKQEQSVFRIRYFTKNKDTGVQEEIRPLTGSKWNLAPSANATTNPYRTFDNQPIYKVIST